ncbi:MAG: hypothetical protein HY278_02445 [candidate division NC10 bacterium]|nr:hypothetical protein [candidate division NC10 bacterium]
MQQNKRGYIRKNLVVSPMSIKELQRLLRVDSESQAVRIAVEDRVLAEKLAVTADRIAKRGGLVDVFEKSAGSRRKRLGSAHRRAGR